MSRIYNFSAGPAVLSEDGQVNDDYVFGWGDFNKIDVKALVGKAVRNARDKLSYGTAPTGAYPVVFAPLAFASLLRTFAPIFSGEIARKGLSRLKDAEGTVIASGEVTIIDDPFYKDAVMPIGFDAEGTPARKKDVVRNGELKTLLYNLKSAAALGKKTTGNASKRDYNDPVGVSPFTMYLAPGPLTEDELLAKAENGVYIDGLGGLHAGANPVTGDFSLQSEGFMIENGKKTGAVKSFTVAGNFYDLLKNVAAVACNTETSTFGGITAFASPAVMVTGLSIAGK